MTRLDLLADKGNQQSNWKGASYNDSVVAFATEKALMLPGGSWVLAAIKQQDPDFKISTFAFPGEKTGQEVTVGAGDLALSISSSTKHKKNVKHLFPIWRQLRLCKNIMMLMVHQCL